MSERTTGPWVAEILTPAQYSELTGKEGHWSIRVKSSKGVTVAEMPKTSLGIATRLANVKLLASAPELLEALQDLICAFDINDPYTEKARAAIAKATNQPTAN